MTKIIDTKITEETIKGNDRPQLKIADRLYTVDNRQSTFDKIQKIENKNDSFEIFKLALGEQAAREIQAMDLPVDKATYLSFCVMGAITGEEPEVIQQRALRELEKK